MAYAKWTLIAVGLIALLMGIWGLVGAYAGVADPQWHAVLKIIVGLVAVAVGLMEEKAQPNNIPYFSVFEIPCRGPSAVGAREAVYGFKCVLPRILVNAAKGIFRVEDGNYRL